MAAPDHNEPDPPFQLEMESAYAPRVFTRLCPLCRAEVHYNCKGNRNSAIKNNKIFMNCENERRVNAYSGSSNPFFGKKHIEETIASLRAREHPHVKTEQFRELSSRQMKGNQNPCRGTSVYEIWVKKFGREKADELRERRREKVSRSSSGENNPMYGKPAPQGSGNGWCGWYKDWFFRSLRELSYMINVIEKQGLKWRTAESAELKIPYIDWKGSSRTYTADFLIDERLLIEVKPSKLKTSKTVLLKQAAAIEFCGRSGLEYKIVDPVPLSDAEIVALHDSGAIRFTDRYEEKFKERFIT